MQIRRNASDGKRLTDQLRFSQPEAYELWACAATEGTCPSARRGGGAPGGGGGLPALTRGHRGALRGRAVPSRAGGGCGAPASRGSQPGASRGRWRLAGYPECSRQAGRRQAAAGTELLALSRPAGAAGAGPRRRRRRRRGPECECEMLPPAAAPRAQAAAAAPAWMRLWNRRFALHKHFYRTHSPC